MTDNRQLAVNPVPFCAFTRLFILLACVPPLVPLQNAVWSTVAYSLVNSSFTPNQPTRYFHSLVLRFGRADNLTVPEKDLDIESYQRGIAVNMGVIVAFGILLFLVTIALFIHSCVKKPEKRTCAAVCTLQ